MRKVQFFILIETVIFTMAFFDIMATEGARAILLFALLLLLVRQLTGGKGIDFLLVSAISLIFLSEADIFCGHLSGTAATFPFPHGASACR